MLQCSRAQASEQDPSAKTELGLRSVHSLACFMFAMRKDIGFKRTRLNERDYLRQLLTHYDNYEAVFDQPSCSD
jgi:hypothetical protein